jgi:hypothetical protein
VETLPVGRRVAFDLDRGRLWVVCTHCAKWNLVPFDSRLEAIDQCERLFRETRTRFSTDNIGLARHREGFEIIRIGLALRPEFAAWRYGGRFVGRRARSIVTSYLGLHRRYTVVARIVREGGHEPLTLSQADINRVRIQHVEGPPGNWGLNVPERTGVVRKWFLPERADHVLLTGADAALALSQMLPVISGVAGSRRQVSNAVAMLEANPTLESFIPRATQVWTLSALDHDMGELGELGAEPRLALEMLANEDAERRWFEGELKLLYRQWQHADQLAAIADSLALGRV